MYGKDPKDHKLDWIDAFPDLATIQDATWLAARRAAKAVLIPAGTVMMRQGDSCHGFVLLARGGTRVYGRIENGREITLYRTQSGEICVLALVNLLQGSPYSAEVVSEEELLIVNISSANFFEAFAQSEKFRALICKTMAKRLNDLIHAMGRVAFLTLELRLSQLLRELYCKHGAPCIQMTHQQLAQELGTSREVASRLLKELERRGHVHLHRGRIQLLSIDNLP